MFKIVSPTQVPPKATRLNSEISIFVMTLPYTFSLTFGHYPGRGEYDVNAEIKARHYGQ